MFSLIFAWQNVANTWDILTIVDMFAAVFHVILMSQSDCLISCDELLDYHTNYKVTNSKQQKPRSEL